MIDSDIDQIIHRLGSLDLNKKTVFISGGAGFIGSWLCDTLIQLGSDVICMDNFSSGLKKNISPLLKNDHFRFMDHDISKPVTLHRKIDIVMHLASRASPFEFDKFPIEILKSNTIGTLNALEIAKKNNAKFLFTSTSEVYGDAEVVPTPETYTGKVNPVGIRGCYDEAKRAGEALSMAFLRQHDTDIRIARIFNTYGPRMRSDGYYGRVVPRFIHQALRNEPITIFGDGNQTRSFCYITDQVKGLLTLAVSDVAKGEIINIGNPEEITVQRLGELVKDILGSTSCFEFRPLPPDDPRRRCPVITRADQVLGWQPEIPVYTGLEKTIRYFRKSMDIKC